MPVHSVNPLLERFRSDLPGRFNEADVLETQWYRLAALLQGIILPPYEVLIHPSSECNLACAWCIGDHVPIIKRDGSIKLVVLDAAKTAAQRLPDTLRDPAAMMRVCTGIVNYRTTARWCEGDKQREQTFRVEAVSFSGLIGEPLVSKAALMPAMNYLVDHDVRVGMFTNGVLMDESTWDTLLRTAYILVSVDAGTGDTYGALKYGNRKSGPAQFERMRRNLIGLLRRRAVTPDTQLAINTAFILYPENHHELYDAARMLKEAGVDCLRVKRDISGDRVLSEVERLATLDQMARVKADLVDASFQFVEIHELRHAADPQRQFSSCTITDLMAAIGSDGKLYPCNYHPRPGGASYGDATEVSFQEVWEGAMRARLKQNLPRICPKVCDPFKNRANQLLESTVTAYRQHGREYAEQCRNELVEIFQATQRT